MAPKTTFSDVTLCNISRNTITGKVSSFLLTPVSQVCIHCDGCIAELVLIQII